MSEQEKVQSLVGAQTAAKSKGKNGQNGKSGLTADSVYFRVKQPKTIVKRDGRIVPFDSVLIENAMARCFDRIEVEPKTSVEELTRRAVNVVAAKYDQPTVEGVQDIVEMVLQAAGEYEAAKAYILYRAEHAKMRVERPVPPEVTQAFAQSDAYFPTQLQKFQFYDKYSRFNYDLGRRETWLETVNRAVDYLKELSEYRLPADDYERVRQAILHMKVMPSMRLLAMAGPAARRNNIAIYNCSYMPVDSIDSFVEALIISMSGCGVGFSVERQYVEQFPRIARQSGRPAETFVVPDSSEGWAQAVRVGLEAWFKGEDIKFDYSEVRPVGAPLRVKGGRASGPEPLRKMLDFARGRILGRQGSFLRTLDAHDIMCAVGDAAVSGGVRRCLPAGTRVHTRRGSIPIEEIVVGDEVMTATGYKPVTGWVDQDVQQIVELVTESGTIFRCTPDHRIAVLTDVWGGYQFKQAQHLTPEDRILFITHPIDGEESDFLPLPHKRAADNSGSEVRQPSLNPESAWFMGKFFADGYVQITPHTANGKGGNTTFSVACHEKEQTQIKRVASWMMQHGLNVNEHSSEQERCAKLRSNNRQIARWMYQYKQPNTPLIIPEEIWRAPLPIRAAFIAGVMDGDGTYADRPVTVVSTIYETFARDLVKLLATLGIIAEVRLRRPATEQGWKPIWVVSIKDALALERAEEMLGDYACQEWVSRKGKQAGYTVPGHLVKQDLSRDVWRSKWPAGRDPNMNSATLTTIVEATHYVPIQVVKIRDGGQAHTYDIEVQDGSTFVAEGYLVHNTAMISLFDYDDLEMRHAKDGDFWRNNSHRWNANNSAVWPDRELTQAEVTRFVLDMVESERGEPGIFNRKAAVENRPERRELAAFGTNPCVTGDTLVAVADGREHVSIAELAQEDKDVPVYCLDNQGKITVRWLRHPRLTGHQKPIYKVTLDDGSNIRVTGNHKFRLKSGDYVEAQSLKPGDSLHVMTRFEASIKDIFDDANSRSQDYFWLNNGSRQTQAEHRVMAAFYHNDGKKIPRGYVVHHKDFDAANNDPENLAIMSKIDHDALHGEQMRGENNPMVRAANEWTEEQWATYRENMSEAVSGKRNGRYSGVTHAELKQHALRLTKQLERRFSTNDWITYAQEHGLPQAFSAWRKAHLGGILGLAKWAALELGLDHIDADPRVVQSYQRYAEMGYDCEIIEGQLYFRKRCEVCGDTFLVAGSQREAGVCSHTCATTQQWQRNRNVMLTGIHDAHATRKEQVRQQQLEVYGQLKFELGRRPLKKEWVEACRAKGISTEISRSSSPFRTYGQLQESATMFNHRVISVELDGYENVYNGTVDEFHNFFVGGWQSETRHGKRKWAYLNNLQCGEIILRPYQFCNLTSAIARADDDYESLREKVELATIIGTIQSMATYFPGLRETWRQNCIEERLLGVDLNGQMDSPAAQDPEIQRKLQTVAVETNRMYAQTLGINQSVSVTCVKPSGNSSQLVNSSSGLHARWAPYYVRNVRVGAHSPVFKVLRDAGVPLDPENGQTRENAITWVVHFPVKSPETAVTRTQRTALEQCEFWLQNKLNYTEHNPSVTITYQPDEVLDLIKWIWEHQDKIGGMAFLPAFDAQYDQMPYVEIGQEEYEQLVEKFPDIDFAKIYRYEEEDLTTAAQELACMAGGCDF